MTDPVAVPSMTTTPPFPDLADRASGTYNLKAFNFGAHMSGPFNSELEAIVAAAYTNAVAANERASTAVDKAALTAVDAEQTALDRIQTGQDRTQAGLDRAAAEAAAAVAGGAAAFIDSNPVVKGSVDATKQVRFEVDGLATATTRVITMPDKDGTLAMTSDIGGLSGTATGTIDLLTGASIASAATINLDAATGNRVHITGTTAITAVTLTRGPRTVIFDGILTLTHHVTNNNLPGAANITTAAGDRAIYESDGTTVYCIAYTRKDGTGVVAAANGLTLLSTVVASASATVDIEVTFDSAYDVYVIEAVGIVPANATGMQCRMKVGGSYDAGANYSYHVQNPTSSASAYAGTGGISQTQIPITVGAAGNDVSDSVNIVMHIFSPSSTSKKKSIHFHHTAVAGTVITNGSGSAANSSTSALTGIRFYMNSGNINSGTFRLYGIRNN